ncbi:hypothetical protein KR032_000951 [Drosophila birchii]|nr:hypothetical protein KR032_000951 [Drosophila birchii]
MSSDRRFYFAADLGYNATAEVEDNEGGGLYPSICKDRIEDKGNNNAADVAVEADKDDQDQDPDDSEFLQDVPYSSSSIDRSSVGSIPWADDAVKKNLLDWERVERLLSGEEPLPEQEPELRNEIADWQRKFPSLLGRRTRSLRHHSFDSQAREEIDSISNLSLNSLDDDDDDEEAEDGFLTPTADLQQRHHQPISRPYLRPSQKKLVDLLDRDLRVTSVSVKLLKRQRSQQHQPQMPISATTQSSARLRMPPILNVLDTNRRFRGLLNNRSFVQLTQVQQKEQQQQHQAKSAVLPNQGNRSAWHMPMAASRFFNNKNAIVLPSLNLGRHRELATTTATSSQSNSSGGGGHNSHGHSNSSSNRSTLHPFGLASVSSNTPSTGRSISAAVHHPRSEFVPSSAFYIPYSASKFKAFK